MYSITLVLLNLTDKLAKSVQKNRQFNKQQISKTKQPQIKSIFLGRNVHCRKDTSDNVEKRFSSASSFRLGSLRRRFKSAKVSERFAISSITSWKGGTFVYEPGITKGTHLVEQVSVASQQHRYLRQSFRPQLPRPVVQRSFGSSAKPSACIVAWVENIKELEYARWSPSSTAPLLAPNRLPWRCRQHKSWSSWTGTDFRRPCTLAGWREPAIPNLKRDHSWARCRGQAWCRAAQSWPARTVNMQLPAENAMYQLPAHLVHQVGVARHLLSSSFCQLTRRLIVCEHQLCLRQKDLRCQFAWRCHFNAFHQLSHWNPNIMHAWKLKSITQKIRR